MIGRREGEDWLVIGCHSWEAQRGRDLYHVVLTPMRQCIWRSLWWVVVRELFEVEWIGLECHHGGLFVRNPIAEELRWGPSSLFLGCPPTRYTFAFVNNLMQLFQKLRIRNLSLWWWLARRALEILLSNGANVEFRVYSLDALRVLSDGFFLSRVTMAFFVLTPILEELQRSPPLISPE